MRSPYSSCWLIFSSERGDVEPLTIELSGGEKALPIFSFEEEAGLYVRFQLGADNGWVPRKTPSTELVSMLDGQQFKYVALDPPPEILPEMSADLVSVGRRNFVDRILSRDRRYFESARARKDRAG